MKEHQLLNVMVPKQRSKSQWVKKLVPNSVHDLFYLEIDLRYLYIVK